MYHEFTPCAALVPFIDKFWVFKGYVKSEHVLRF